MESGPRKKLVRDQLPLLILYCTHEYLWSSIYLFPCCSLFLSLSCHVNYFKPFFFSVCLVINSGLSVVCLQFEYQQAQLEAEIENLSWKVERADSYERGVVGGEGEPNASDRGVREGNAWCVNSTGVRWACDRRLDFSEKYCYRV